MKNKLIISRLFLAGLMLVSVSPESRAFGDNRSGFGEESFANQGHTALQDPANIDEMAVDLQDITPAAGTETAPVTGTEAQIVPEQAPPAAEDTDPVH